MKKIIFFLLFPILSFSQIDTQNIQIARDQWGVPHIFGKTDAEVAYGLAWAHSEDDFKTIQLTILAGKGMLGRLNGKDGAAIDYVLGLLNCKETAAELQHTLSADFVALANGYLEGLNKYAFLHPEEILVKKSFPVSLEEYLSGIILSLSVISGVDGVIKDLYSGNTKAIEKEEAPKGSNAFALSSLKTKDGATYLNINSHQPLEGPVAWYEAHLQSEEGWNMLGGLFPVSCVIFHGTNENLGWAHTVNKQDKIDVYQLEMKGSKYLFDNEWIPLEKKKIKLKVKMGFLTLSIGKKAYQSKYGPTMKTKKGYFSIRLGANQDVRGLEQWYRMNKARNFSEFYTAMEMLAIPGFNTIYADKNDTIFYVSNGQIPIRNADYNWKGTLPGNTSETLWTKFHPFKDLPQYINPKSGYLYNTNNTPFHASGEQDNLNPNDFDPTSGYEMYDNNRSMRFKELIDSYDKLSYEDFKAIKYDGQYPSKFHFPMDINVLFSLKSNQFPAVKEEINRLQKWDRKTDINNHGAALFSVLIYLTAEKYGAQNFDKILNEKEIIELLTEAKTFMLANFQSTDIPLGEVQKLVRGEKEIAVWGLPDVLTAMYSQDYKNGIRKAVAGESYIQMVKFRANQLPEIESVINYGASNHEGDNHYADQMELFLDQKTKKMTLDKETVLKDAVRIYSPK